MKKYFARLLPDPKIIDSNEQIKKEYPIQDDCWPSRRRKENGDYCDMSGWEDKLFLCSRDIQVGDKVYHIGRERNAEAQSFLVERLSDPIEIYGGRSFYFDNGYFSSGLILKIIGEISPDSLSFVTEGQEFDEEETTYSAANAALIEQLRKDFEQRTGLGLGSWVKDSEDGYKTRYQGAIYDYKENGGDLQILYGCVDTFGGSTWGYERHIVPMEKDNGLPPVPVRYPMQVVRVKCPTCKHFH